MGFVTRQLKDYEDSGPLNALVNIHAALDEHTFLTKSGGLMQFLRLKGVDAECLDATEREHIARRVEAALRAFDERFRVYQYVVKGDHSPISHVDGASPKAAAAAAERIAWLTSQTAPLAAFSLYIVVVCEGWSPSPRERNGGPKNALATVGRVLSISKTVAYLEEGVDRACETLARQVSSFVTQLQATVPLERLDKQEAFAFLRRLLNYSPETASRVRLVADSFVDYQACDTELEAHRDHLRLGDYTVRVLTLKIPPAQTWAGLLEGLQRIPGRFIVASEWKRLDSFAVRRHIQSKRRHYHNSRVSLASYVTATSQTNSQDLLVDDSAVALVRDLGACLEELEVKGQTFGEYSLSVVLCDTDPALVRRATSECLKVFGTFDAHLTDERYNLLNAWLAVLPGNSAHNLRRLWVTGSNYADLALVFSPSEGAPANPHLAAEYLAVLETDQRTPFFLNLHVQDNAHTLVTGATGSGKSFLVNFLLESAQKYGPRIFVFDLGGSYEALARRWEGACLRIGQPGTVRINPFCLPPSPENLRFLVAFCRVLIESGDYRLTTADESDLAAQIENLYTVEPSARRLRTLAQIVNRSLGAQLERWVQRGTEDSLFDNAHDTLSFSTLQVFDFEGLDSNPEVLEPLFFYILHRASATINDPALSSIWKLFVLDEAWRLVKHPTLRNYLIEGMKTWRKKGASVLLATQSIEDLARSDVLSVVLESCATQIFLANPGMNAELYRSTFHLNDTETARIASLIPKQQLLIRQSGRSKVLNLRVEPAAPDSRITSTQGVH